MSCGLICEAVAAATFESLRSNSASSAVRMPRYENHESAMVASTATAANSTVPEMARFTTASGRARGSLRGGRLHVNGVADRERACLDHADEPPAPALERLLEPGLHLVHPLARMAGPRHLEQRAAHPQARA